MELLHRRFEFPDGCSVREVVVRETNGLDEQQAALAADARSDGSLFTELLRLAIVLVDGERVQQPFMDIERWNSRTRALLMKAFEQMNELPDEQVAAFLAMSEQVEAPGVTALKDHQEKQEVTG